MTKVLNFTIGNSCDEAQFETSTRAIKTTLFANLDDKIECSKVLSVNFMVEDMFTTIKTLPPFIHRIELKSHVRLKITILLEDGNLHTFYHHVLLEPGSHHTSVSCKFNPDAEKRAAKPMPLTDRSYHIELDLQVPYPYSRSSYCHPSKIAEYLESRSEMRCVYTGFYPEEIDPEGGNQIPPYNFSGKGVMYRPYDENAAALTGPKRGFKRSKSSGGDRSTAASASLIKTMYNGIPWKLAFDSKAPVNVSGSGQPSNLILISPVVRCQAGLGMIFNMLLVIAGASSEVHLKHRPGYRVGISILDMELPQIVKIAQQYFKFEDVFESLTCDTPVADLHKQKSSAQTEVIYANGCDMKTRARETTLYRENAAQGVSKKKLIQHKLIGECKILEDLLQVTCPHQRFSLRKVRDRGYVEFRMEKNRMSMHFLSCFIQLVLRLVDNSASAPPPKMFVKKGPGKSFNYREEKFFYWLIRDRYLRDEFTDMRRQQRMGETLADDIAVALDKLTQAPRSGVPIINTGRLTVEEMRVESRRHGISVGVIGKSSPKEISSQSFSDVLGEFPEDEKTDALVGSQRTHPTSPTNAIPSNLKNGSSSSRNGKLRSKQLVNTSATKKVEFIKNTS